MKIVIIFSAIIFSIFLLLKGNEALGDDEVEILTSQQTILIEHSLDHGLDPKFTQRGSLSIKSLKSAYVQVSTDIAISDEEKAKLMHLVEKNGLYRLRFPIKVDDAFHYLYTSLKACSLYESLLSDILTLHTDSSGSIIGISASTVQPQCKGSRVSPSLLHYFNTTVNVQSMENGPIPDTAAFVQKMEKEKSDKAKQEQGDNRSFFAKYWMYILPVVIFLFISSITNQEQGGAAGGR